MGIKTLARQSTFYLLGQIAVLLVGFYSFRLFTHVLSVADYGTADLISRLVLLGTALGKLGVQNAVMRFYEAKTRDSDKLAVKRHFSTALVGTGLAGLVVAAILGGLFVVFNPAESHTEVLALAAGGLALSRILHAILLNILRVEERPGMYAMVNVGTRILTVASIVGLFAVAGENLKSYFFGTVVVEALVVIALLIWLNWRGLLGLDVVDWQAFREMVAFGLPLIAFETMTIMMDAGDRVLIRYYLGATSLGFYTAAFALCLYLHDLMMTPINLAMTPLYLKIWANEGAAATSAFLSQSLRMYIMAACGVLAGVIACANDAVILLASKKFEASVGLVPWIVAGMFLYAANSFFNAGMVIHKQTANLAKFSLIVVLFKLVCNSLLLPRLGLNGAVISTVTAYALFLFLTARASLPMLPLKVDMGTLMRAGLALGAAAFCALQVHLESHLIGLLVRGCCSVVVYATVLASIDGEARGYLKRGWQVIRRLQPAAPVTVGLAYVVLHLSVNS